MATRQRRHKIRDPHMDEDPLRLAMLATQDVIWDWDMVKDVVRWSETVLAAYGYQAAEVPRGLRTAHEWWLAHIHPDDVSRVEASLQTFLGSGKDLWSAEYRFRSADGSYVQIYDRGTLVRNAAGVPVRMVGAMSDITARRQAEEALRLRLRQQEAVATLGQQALQGAELNTLMDHATVMLTQLLNVEFAKVLELLPSGDSLVLRAGTGWRPGMVGQATEAIGASSQAGYALYSREPVIVEDLLTDTRFSAPSLLVDHGVVSGLSVIIHDQPRPYGVLGVHSRRRRAFGHDDVNVVQAVANILGQAVARQRIEAKLTSSERQYRLLFDGNPFPMWVLDAKLGLCLAVNDAAVEQFGYARREFLAMSGDHGHSPHDFPALIRLLQSSLASEPENGRAPTPPLLWKCRRKDGRLLDIELIWNAIEFGGRAAILLLARDVAKRLQAKANLLRRTQELTAMVSIAHTLAGVEPFEQKAKSMIETMKTLGGGDIAVLRLPDARHAALRAVADSGPSQLRARVWPFQAARQGLASYVYERGETVVINDYRTDTPLPQMMAPLGVSSAAVFPLKVGEETLGTVGLSSAETGHFTPERVQLLSAIASGLGILVKYAKLHAETEQRLQELHTAHMQLQELSHLLLEVQETERRHIARELHDEIGQLLTAIHIYLDTSSVASKGSPPPVKTVQGLVHELMDKVRNLSLDLRPPMLDDLGLLPTLLWHFKRYTAQSHVRVSFRHAGLEHQRFPAAMESAAFRIVQEALTNVARHAQVQHVRVRIWSVGERFTIQIKDHGRGFDPHAPRPGHNGLLGIGERVRLLHGTLSIESAPGGGTCLTAHWPLVAQEGPQKHGCTDHPGR